MTREEILRMKPGRELDELVMCEVMKENFFYGPSHYSTNIEAAWQLVLRVTSNMNFEIGYLHNKWFCSINNKWPVEAETAPEAICKSALLAVLDE